MAPKRARKPKTSEDDAVDYEEGAGESGEEYVEEKPKKKQKKAAASKGKKKVARGAKLQYFKTMPLDILSEICRHCDPLTLLHLTRAAQAFRHLLLSPSGKVLWKAARRSVDLPDITAPDLTEWAYASLVFERTCHICQKSKAITVDYALRARACASCMRANSKQVSKMHIRNLHPAAFECCPSSLWMDYEFWWIPTVQHISNTLRALQAEPAPEEGKESVYDRFVRRRNIIVVRAKKDATQIRNWEAGASMRKENEIRELKRSRRRKIEAKMIDLGWKETDFGNNYQWSVHKSVDQPRDLTERIWNTIRPGLIALLEEQKAAEESRRLAQELQARQLRHKPLLAPLYKSLRASLPSDSQSSFPPFTNFTLLPSVKPFWATDDVEATPETLSAASEVILAEARSWVQQFKVATYIKLAKAHGEVSPDRTYSTTDLDALSTLATSSFSCGRASCKFSATYSSIVSHLDAHIDWSGEKKAVDESQLSTSGDRIKAISIVIVAAGLDPQTATVEQLNALGEVFSCQPCPEDSMPVVGKGPMNWSEIVAHALEGHSIGPYHLRKYSPPRVVMAGQQEEKPQVASDVVEKPAEVVA